jgi:hypothetical protein
MVAVGVSGTNDGCFYFYEIEVLFALMLPCMVLVLLVMPSWWKVPVLGESVDGS